MKTPTELTRAILEVIAHHPPEEQAPAVERLIVTRDAEVEAAHARELINREVAFERLSDEGP